MKFNNSLSLHLLQVAFGFRSPIYANLTAIVFEQVAAKMLEAFISRLRQLHRDECALDERLTEDRNVRVFLERYNRIRAAQAAEHDSSSQRHSEQD